MASSEPVSSLTARIAVSNPEKSICLTERINS
jgi:hypothetical protein